MNELDESFWHYFLMLESDFNATTRFVEVSEDNDQTYSIEYARQLVSICTEFETVARKLCSVIDGSRTATNITDYKEIILSKYPEIHTAPVYIDRYKQKLYPLASLGNKDTPDWWKTHQDVKHHRHENFEKATLKNTLEALSSLLILELYLYGTVYSTCDKIKHGTILLRAPGMGEEMHSQPEEYLPHLPKVLPQRNNK